MKAEIRIDLFSKRKKHGLIRLDLLGILKKLQRPMGLNKNDLYLDASC